MTPATQSPETRAMSLLLNATRDEDKSVIENEQWRKSIKELTTLITKADAFDWLEKQIEDSPNQVILEEGQSSHNLWVRINSPSNFLSSNGETLLSAITEAMKGRE